MEAAKAAGADLAEVRVDLLDDDERVRWAQLVTEKTLPVVVTNRASWEGGKGVLDETERLSVLVEAEQLGAEYIDVELKAASVYRELRNATGAARNAKLILSHHNFERPLSKEELARVQERMISEGADVSKIAMAATSALDNALVFDALLNATVPTVVLAMGEFGQVSRILAPKYGSFLTFASVGVGRESAPGQVVIEKLTDTYRFRSLTPETPVYGVIGNPVSHSMSPALHNAAMKEAGVDGVYVPLKVGQDIPAFIRSMVSYGFAGFSVTIPGKVVAMDAMDTIDSVANKIGAMNTVVKQADGQLKGYNTDWVAAISAIEDGLKPDLLSEKRVVCIGAGGAARGLAFGALERGASHVLVVNRTVAKAQALATELGPARASAVSLDDFNESDAAFDILMNTTSVGMHPSVDDTPVRSERLLHKPLVFDAVYNPLKTRLLREASAAGCTTVSGLEMFVRQAAEQFRFWFEGVEVPVKLMRQVVVDSLES